ncbi:MAG: alpha/beta fold hydrolase [Muricomes sp.]
MQKAAALLKGIEKMKSGDKMLLCFPFAGGGASAFYSWNGQMSEAVKVCPVQLPGREERIMEKPYTDMESLVDDVIESLHYVEQEFIVFGHSMGAKMAYEAVKRLEKEHKKVQLLIVSGSRAPHIPEPNPIYHLADKDFKKELARFEGTPKEILENEDLLDFFLPMLRADFTLDEVYQARTRTKLQCPILALGGSNDSEADHNELLQWNDYTVSEFEYRIFQGGHFFIKTRESEIFPYIRQKILEYTNVKNYSIR